MLNKPILGFEQVVAYKFITHSWLYPYALPWGWDGPQLP